MAQVRKISAYSAVVVGLALLLSGCALAGRTFGRYVDDKTLTGSVKMSLATLHVSHLKRVNVDVYDGTVYLSGEPGSKPFVGPGDTVKEGDTLLIVEAMKVMNQIQAPRAGTVREVLVVDAQPVEYDQPLVIIE